MSFSTPGYSIRDKAGTINADDDLKLYNPVVFADKA